MIFSKIKKKAENFKESVKDTAKNASEKVKDYVPENISDCASNVTSSIKESVENLSDKAGEYLDSHLDEIESYCSWCFKKCTCTAKEKNNLKRNIYICDNCGNEVVKCRACNNKAKSGEKWNWESQFCAVHEGSIAKFETLNWSLSSIGEYRDILERTERNYKKIGTTAAYTIGGAAVIAPLAFAAAPAVGGAIGSNLLGYSGVAATNAGLATLGGGALAAGGAGMAGGVAVVTATGSALGGSYGAVISNSYYGDIDGFEIIRVKQGIEPAIICIDGFLTEKEKEAPESWIDPISTKYPDNAIFYVRWEAKRLRDIGKTFGLSAGKAAGFSFAKKFALSASKKAAAKLAPLSLAFQTLNIAKNPWSVASLKAFQTGALLADLIARTDKYYVLIGHSLGAKVIYSCLSALKTKDNKFIRDVHLLGGAITNYSSENCDGKTTWFDIDKVVTGSINNYYSKNDSVLKLLYKVGEGIKFDFGDPIGRNRIDNCNINNIDTSEYVSGHSNYKGNIHLFLNVEP